MVKMITPLLLSLVLFSCNHHNNAPDVSNIKMDLTLQRFDEDLFKTDSAHFAQHFDSLKITYPIFSAVYLTQLQEFNPAVPPDTLNKYLGGFLNFYRDVFDSSELLYKDFSSYKKEIEEAFRFTKYYFPNYRLPSKIVTYIGPVEGTGSFLFTDDNTIAIGLEHYLGKNFPLYKTDRVEDVYADYISARFEPSYIVVNCMQNIISDMYPEKETEDPMVNRMVEQGKRLYLLSKFLPDKEDYKLIGYTEQQMKDCYKHEAEIWDMFIQNNLLHETDPDVIKNYVGESPKTQGLPEGAPGNIGSFAGWQIVKKYMEKNDKVTLQGLLSTDDDKIFQEAKYKP